MDGGMTWPALDGLIIAALEPRTTSYVVWDSLVETLGVKVHPSGRKDYVSRHTLPSGRKSNRIIASVNSTSLESARQLIQSNRSEIRHRNRIRSKKAKHQSPDHDFVISTAERLFFKHGNMASVQMIADEAGTTRQSIYNNFGNKEQLFRLVLARMANDIGPNLTYDANRPISKQLYEFAKSYRRFVTSDRAIHLYYLSIERPVSRLRTLTNILRDRFTGEISNSVAKFLERAIEEGRIEPIPIGISTEIFLSAITGFERTNLMTGQPASSAARSDAQLRQIVKIIVQEI